MHVYNHIAVVVWYCSKQGHSGMLLLVHQLHFLRIYMQKQYNYISGIIIWDIYL